VLENIIARLGQDSVEPGADTERTMGFGNTIMVWLAANMVVTILLTGTLFVPGIPYVRAILIILLGTLLGVTVLSLVGCIGTPLRDPCRCSLPLRREQRTHRHHRFEAHLWTRGHNGCA
jgi:purine-cytosine permease-like protein